MLIDLSPLRSSSAFRRVWIGSAASAVGGQLTSFAVILSLWDLTRSPLWVGLAGLVKGLSIVCFALVGGALADAMDRRKLALTAEIGQILATAAMTALAFVGSSGIGVILALLAVQSACSALGSPARKTFVVSLLPRSALGAGLALTSVVSQSSMLIGPALAGLIATADIALCFALGTALSAGGLYGIIRLPAQLPELISRPGRIAELWGGVRLVTQKPILVGAFLTDLDATVLAMPVALFPSINSDRFGGEPNTLGLMTSALSIGGLAAGTISSRYARSHRPGRWMLGSVALWGASLITFALVEDYWLALLTLAAAGAADTVCVVTRGTIVQLETEDSYRGRINAVDHVVGVAGPEIGNARAGVVAGMTSAPASLAIGGTLCILGALALTVFGPAVRDYETAPASRSTDQEDRRSS